MTPQRSALPSTGPSPKLGKIPKIPRATAVKTSNQNAVQGQDFNSNQRAVKKKDFNSNQRAVKRTDFNSNQRAVKKTDLNSNRKDVKGKDVDIEDQSDTTPMPSDSEEKSWLDMEPPVPKPVKRRFVSHRCQNRRQNFERVDNKKKERRRKKVASKARKEKKMLDRAKATTGKREVKNKKRTLMKEEKRRKEAEELKKKEEDFRGDVGRTGSLRQSNRWTTSTAPSRSSILSRVTDQTASYN